MIENIKEPSYFKLHEELCQHFKKTESRFEQISLSLILHVPHKEMK